MKITLKTYGQIAEVLGSSIIELEIQEEITLAELLEVIQNKYGTNLTDKLLNDEGKLRSFFNVIVNSNTVGRDDFSEITLKSGDQVNIVPFVAGG